MIQIFHQADFELVNVNLPASKTSGDRDFGLDLN